MGLDAVLVCSSTPRRSARARREGGYSSLACYLSRRTLLPPSSVSFSVLSSMVSGLFVVRWRPRTRILHARYTKMRPDTTATPRRLSARRRPARHRSVLADDDLLGETELQAVHPITDSPTSLTHLRMRGDPARRADAAALLAGRIKSFINTSLSCGGG
ncbi:hypothetical protein C8F04DRAFT_154058 [Mycena alexandri]|uniref:Uncharacterized protein n=1 Tax=Mycena alexandri TaxID=1745969 RepID=A0AAD6WTS9_9AGAR|nr:hypothetical protein C8F04DRAFT_154058 [Mycena alexandri]